MGLIVNADDFGKDLSTTEAIVEAFDKKYIDRTTLMANMETAKQAAEIARELGIMDKVGIHLNITEGRPLTDGIRNNPLICDSEGRFSAAFYNQTKYRLYMDQLTIDQIEEEFRAQLKMYHDLGFTLNHVDSHHHVHTNYPVYLAIKKLSKEYNFSSIRLSRNLYRGGSAFNAIYKKLYNSAVIKLAASNTDYFGSYRDFITYFGLNEDNKKEIDSSLAVAMNEFVQKNSVEIMVHPMYKGGVLTDSGIPMDLEKEIHHE